MPEIIACPDCGRKLRVPDDLLGRKVKCPGCNIMFTASVIGGASPQSVGTAPRPEPRRDDRVRRDEPDVRYDDGPDDRRSIRDAWKRVRLGLTWVIISIYVFLGGVGVGILGGLVLGAATGSSGSLEAAVSTASTGMIVLKILTDLIGLVEQGFKVTGFAFGMAVPPKRNNPVRGLAMATFIVGIAGAGLFVVARVIEFFVGLDTATSGLSPGAIIGSGGSGVVGLIAVIVLFAGFIVFLFYLRFLCLAVRRDALASTVTTLMICIGALALVFVFIIGVMMYLMGASLNMALGGNPLAGSSTLRGTVLIGTALLCVWAIASLALFIWYVVVLHQVRGAVHSYIRKL